MSCVPYARAVKSLMYAMMCIQLDICYAIGLVSRFQSNPGLAHWKVVKRMLHNLKGTMHYMLCYWGIELCPIGYSDVDWDGDVEEQESTTAYVFLLNRVVVTWASKKQTCIALSMMEVESVACFVAVQEVVWLRHFVHDLNIERDDSDPMAIYCDSMIALAYAKNSKYHVKAKCI